MKKSISLLAFAMLLLSSVAFASPQVSLGNTDADLNVDIRSDLSDRIKAEPIDDIQFVPSEATSSQGSHSNGRACDPSWKGLKGTPSIYDPSEKRNIPAGISYGSGVDKNCPTLNPEFVRVADEFGWHPLNVGRDVVNAEKYWGSEWTPRINANGFNPQKARFSFFEWVRSHRAN